MTPVLFYVLWGWVGVSARHETVVVTGTPEPVPLEEADRAVRSIPLRGQELLFNTYVDILQLDAALDLRQRGPNGTQADLSVRGGTFGQTLILWNGRRMNDPQSGHHNLDLPIPLESMESVEMMRGAGSFLYGSDAVGGVVNVITRAPETPEIRLRVSAGNFGVNQERVSLSGSRGRWTEMLTGARDFSSGFRPDRDYRSLAIASATTYRSSLGMTDVDLAWSDRPFGADQFYGNYPSWERTKSQWAGLRQTLGERTEADFSYRRHTDLFVLFRDQPQIFENRHAAQSWEASFRRREPLSPSSTFFWGGEGFGDEIDSTNLGHHSRARGAAYAGWDARVMRRFSFTAGVRGEVYRGLPGQWSPSISGGYWAGGKVKLRAAVSRAFRVPSYTDLYYHDPANLGSPTLRPEKAWSYEAGADWRPARRVSADVTVFHRRDRDVIDYVRSSPADIWRATNIQNLNFTGVETGVRWTVSSQTIDLRYTALHGVAEVLSGLQSRYAFQYPVHSGLASWQALIARQVACRTRIGALKRIGGTPYAVWDAYVARSQGRIRPFVQFTNLANVTYQEVVGVVMPGRAIVGGVELRLTSR